jgi:hypothetical protein
MKPIVVPIVTLGDISVVEVVVNIVVMAKVVGRVNPRRFIHNKKYIDLSIEMICTLLGLDYE